MPLLISEVSAPFEGVGEGLVVLRHHVAVRRGRVDRAQLLQLPWSARPRTAITGESASIAWSLPDTTAAVAWSWPWYWSIWMAALPADVHFFERAVMSSACTVAFWTRSSCRTRWRGRLVGVARLVAHWVPALK